MRGPLNIARPVQGWPVIVQAGASEAGPPARRRDGRGRVRRAARLADGQAFYADVKGRMDALGRDPRSSEDPAGRFRRGRRDGRGGAGEAAQLDSLVHYESAIAALSIALGHDASRFDPDAPLPEIPESNASKSSRERVVALASRENLTVRQLAPETRRLFAASPSSARRRRSPIRWRNGSSREACDGFNVMFPYLPGGLDDFVDQVVPELQRRGMFRREYEGTTLRENLGLPRPPNRFF